MPATCRTIPSRHRTDCSTANGNGYAKQLVGSLLTRAPEAWEGKGYFHSSDLWALGVTLFEELGDGAFSFPVPRDDVLVDTIMLAKLMRLFPEWDPSPGEGPTICRQPLAKAFADAKRIKDSIAILPLEQQLQQMGIPKVWRRFLRVLLTLDPKERSASTVLQSPEYQAILQV